MGLSSAQSGGEQKSNFLRVFIDKLAKVSTNTSSEIASGQMVMDLSKQLHPNFLSPFRYEEAALLL